MFRLLAKFFAFNVFKFSLVGNFPKDPKFVIAVVPHTSNWDFIIAIGVRTYLKEPIHFVGKKELFTPLTSWFFKRLGGMPLNRKRMSRWLMLLPECTAKNLCLEWPSPQRVHEKVDEWKTGFYYIAKSRSTHITHCV